MHIPRLPSTRCFIIQGFIVRLDIIAYECLNKSALPGTKCSEDWKSGSSKSTECSDGRLVNGLTAGKSECSAAGKDSQDINSCSGESLFHRYFIFITCQ